MSLSGSDDYEPSQFLDDHESSQALDTQETLVEMLVTRRSTRFSSAGSRNASFFGAGGALDSQTTDSQFLDALCAAHTESNDIVTKDAGVQTDAVEACGLHAGGPVADSACGCDDESAALRAQLERLQAAYNAVEDQLERARAILNTPPEVLDPSEESQVMLDLRDFSTARRSTWGTSSVSSHEDTLGCSEPRRMLEDADSDVSRPSKLRKRHFY